MSSETKKPVRGSVITETQRQSVRSKVAHAAKILHAQGPISTFIHTNPLHSLEHLPFEQAVQVAARLLGGQGDLSNEQFRGLYLADRIPDRDRKVVLSSIDPKALRNSLDKGSEVAELRRAADGASEISRVAFAARSVR